MKKTIVVVLIVIVGLVLIFRSCGSRGASSIQGNGDIKTSEISVGSFDFVSISGSASVIFHQSHERRVVISVDSNLQKYTDISVKRGVLSIGTKEKRVCIFTQYLVEIYAPSLLGVTITDSGSFESKDTIIASRFETKLSGSGKLSGNFVCDDFNAEISGSGEVKGHIECTLFTGDISGSGKMTISGNSDRIQLTIVGSGVFEGNNFRVNNAFLDISGSGNVYMRIMDNLSADVSGFGVVRYWGNPKIEFRGSGSGSIERADGDNN